ncbi:NHL repeat-containing protein [Pseudomonas huanghezhanensis]|uniref:hypothetical protein n=1 Tax=Pseudomonas huanghezhanensis TaxID=3002903 RepID=UPI002286C3E8|nr:hypothetical protein [Pseudomonas sp. BSw22131]
MAGSLREANLFHGFFARYDEAGALDTQYGENGFVLVENDIGSSIEALAMRSVESETVLGVGTTAVPNRGLLIGKNMDGSADLELAGGNIVISDFTAEENAWLQAAVSPASGRIVAVGFTEGFEEADVLIARYLPTGSLDNSFGEGGGWVRTKIGKSVDMGQGLSVQPDEKIIVCGTTFTNDLTEAFVLRYIG